MQISCSDIVLPGHGTIPGDLEQSCVIRNYPGRLQDVLYEDD